MLEHLKRLIKDLLKIPPQPEPPFGAPGSVRIFRAAPAFFAYRMLDWSFRQFSALLGILFVLYFVVFNPPKAVSRIEDQMYQYKPLEDWNIPISVGHVWAAFELLAIVGFVGQLPLTFLMVYLDYEYRWYIITDRSLRIREGLVRVDERTMTFSNIQNVSIRQGPVQRFFGISNLEVSTAGGGSGTSAKSKHDLGNKDQHQAFFRGIANSAEVRDAILVHLRSLRASGLGDPDEDHARRRPEPPHDAAAPGVLEAARRVLEETRALRGALS